MSRKAKLTKEEIEDLETMIGHAMTDRDRLELALTHSSSRKGSAVNYERLEFLGDRVLGLVIAELLFKLFPDAKEGDLSVRLNRLVSARICAAVADELELHRFIKTGADVKNLTGKRMASVRADAMELLIAAVYLEGGLEAARDFIVANWESRARASDRARRDAKTELQEWAHSRNVETPSYTILDRTGPDHEPHFTVQVLVQDTEPEIGLGRSRRIAEQEAATRLLEREGVWQKADHER